jgi:peptidoglycan/LPS O-acetylase OafA/YrhL
MVRKGLSLYLDLLRLAAAVVVLLGHAGEVFRMPLPAIVGHSAKEGVVIFFVLSGFVISYVTSSKETDWRQYASARAMRMYSVAPLAILVMLAVDAMGVYLNRGWYAAHSLNSLGFFNADWSIFSLLRYLTFTNELWFSHVVVGSGAPYWSLGFEVPYYIFFALLFFTRGPLRIALCLAWAAIFGPKILAFLPLWMIGVFAFRLVKRDYQLGALAAWGLFALTGAGALAWRLALGIHARPIFEWGTPTELAINFVYCMGLGLLMAGNIAAFSAATREGRAWPQWAERPIRWFAGASFTIYIMHLPFLALFAAAFPAVEGSLGAGFLALGGVIAIMLLLAELGERRKRFFERALARLKSGILRSDGDRRSAA